MSAPARLAPIMAFLTLVLVFSSVVLATAASMAALARLGPSHWAQPFSDWAGLVWP